MSDNGLTTNGDMRVSATFVHPTIRICSADGRNLLAIHPDGRVDGEIEDASEAAAVFVRELRAMGGEPSTKPREVATVEELDALPRLTAIRTGDRIWQKLGGKWPYHEWQAADGGFARSSDDFLAVNGSAVVVFTPEVTR